MRYKMKNITYRLHCSLYATILLLLLGAAISPMESTNSGTHENKMSTKNIGSSVDVGLLLDGSWKTGALLKSFVEMAHSDFYAVHSSYTTRLALRTKYSSNSIDAASAVVELLKVDQVKAILGPKNLVEAKFIVELGEKSHVPIISFDGASYSSLYIQRPYLIANAVFNASIAPIIALVKGFEWQEVVFVYEDGVYDTDIFPSLLDSFQNARLRIPYRSVISHTATNDQISKELRQLDELQTMVFLVHTGPKLGSRLFRQAKRLEMMREGYVWVITDALANSLHFIDPKLMKSMDGVLGVRPHVLPLSRELEIFKRRWQKHSHMMNAIASSITTHELSVYGSWAYDTIWALATVVEGIGNEELSFVKANNNKNGGGISQLGISRVGHQLLKEITNTSIRGLIGEFFLSSEERDLLTNYEIINLDGGQRIVGYWNPHKGIISRELDSNDKLEHSTRIEGLKKIIWPGDTITKPYGWVPKKGKKLIVGVPKKMGFTQFVKVEMNNDTREPKVTGFCIDLFEEALKLLPFQVVPKYIPFVNSSDQNNGTYDQLLNQLQTKVVDAVIGDITILSRRTKYMDFTLPYMEPGISMLVPIKDDRLGSMWVFIRPLRWDLWCTIAGACLFVGLAIRILERNTNPPWKNGLFFWFPILILAFPERKIVDNNWSRFVLVIWLFMAYIIMQGYTASLSAIMTVSQLQPSRTTYSCVGYYGGSYTKGILRQKLKYEESQLRPYQTMEDYHLALEKGCQNGGVDAIFEDIPNIRLFLREYGSRYVTVGPTYRTDGFGFAFPLGSPLVSHISRAILNVTESEHMQKLEDEYFGPNYSSQDFYPQISPEAPGLSTYNFAGLFIVTAFATIVALLCSESTFGALQVKDHAEKQGSSFSSSNILAVEDDHDHTVSIDGVCTNIILPTHDHQDDAIVHGLEYVDADADADSDSDSIHEEIEPTIRHNTSIG